MKLSETNYMHIGIRIGLMHSNLQDNLNGQLVVDIDEEILKRRGLVYPYFQEYLINLLLISYGSLASNSCETWLLPAEDTSRLEVLDA